MQYRLTVVALILIGFMVINYFTNDRAQQQVTRWTDSMYNLDQQATAADTDMLEELRAFKAFEDSLNALDVRAATSIALRNLYRAQFESTQQLRTAEFLRAALWRQTLLNLLWGLVSAVFLLPLAVVLDGRAERRVREGAGSGKGSGKQVPGGGAQAGTDAHAVRDRPGSEPL